jgi:hypothetical protein
MRAVNEKDSAPAFEGILQGVEGLVRIDVETVGPLNALSQEIGADKPDAALES